ncbi:MAG: hypothetical protein EOO22_02665 [Comamonadaceae bacterium]|nr:MAG: hypothetical protein EOO22_02665 [Comamonadaceae bacterium]
MTTRLSDSQAFAAVLARLVNQRCAESKAVRVSRTGLQSSVPVNERPYVRRGLDALLDHAALAMHGESIGLTTLGRDFISHVASLEDRLTASMPLPPSGDLKKLLAALDDDERLRPTKPLEQILTLPGRLENYRSSARATQVPGWAFALATGAVVLMVWMATMH